jgi:hypothetical protein
MIVGRGRSRNRSKSPSRTCTAIVSTWLMKRSPRPNDRPVRPYSTATSVMSQPPIEGTTSNRTTITTRSSAVMAVCDRRNKRNEARYCQSERIFAPTRRR